MSRQTRTIHIRAPLVIKNFIAESCVVKDPGVKKVPLSKPPTKDELDKLRAQREERSTKLRWKEVTPTFVNDRSNRTGGVTVLLTGDPDDNSGLVEVQVAFCSKHDAFNRKKGRRVAAGSEKYVIRVTDIPRELNDIEHQMLCELSAHLRKNHETRNELLRPSGWAFAMYFFLPKQPEVQ